MQTNIATNRKDTKEYMFKKATLCCFKIDKVQPSTFHIATSKMIVLHLFSSIMKTGCFYFFIFPGLGISMKLISLKASLLIFCLRPHLLQLQYCHPHHADKCGSVTHIQNF